MTTINGPEKRRQNMNNARGIAGMAMGILYIVIAFFVVYFEQKKQIDIGAGLSYVLGGIMVLYGIFRMYRGYKMMKGQINY